MQTLPVLLQTLSFNSAAFSLLTAGAEGRAQVGAEVPKYLPQFSPQLWELQVSRKGKAAY